MNAQTRVVLGWERGRARLAELVAFFVDNISTDYISHGEVLEGRATTFDTWAPDLAQMLQKEFGRCLDADAEGTARLGVLEVDGEIAGIAVLQFASRASGALAILSDLVIHRNQRGTGCGGRLLAWIEAELASEGIETLLLESGARNRHAHEFFEHRGFELASVVMVKGLGSWVGPSAGSVRRRRACLMRGFEAVGREPALDGSGKAGNSVPWGGTT